MGRMRQIGQMLCLAMLGLATAAAWPVTIGWDGSPGAKYRVYHGRSSRAYTSVVDAGTNTQLRLTLPAGDNFIAVTAFNEVGESDYSKEIWFYASNTAVPALNLRVEASEVLPDGSLFPDGHWETLFSTTVTNNGTQRFFRMTLK